MKKRVPTTKARQISRILLLAVLFSCSYLGHANQNQLGMTHQVQDWRYGMSLYAFFQKQYFMSLTHLNIGDTQNILLQDPFNPKLLSANLSVHLGLEKAVIQLINEFQTKALTELSQEEQQTHLNILAAMQFFLGRNYYQQQQHSLANTYFNQINMNALYVKEDSWFFNDKKPVPFKNEMDYYQAMSLIKHNELLHAAHYLDYLHEDDPFQVYLLHNLAVAHARIYDNINAEYYWGLIRLDTLNDDEKQALLPQIQLAKAQHWQQNSNPDKALEALSLIEINTPWWLDRHILEADLAIEYGRWEESLAILNHLSNHSRVQDTTQSIQMKLAVISEHYENQQAAFDRYQPLIINLEQTINRIAQFDTLKWLNHHFNPTQAPSSTPMATELFEWPLGFKPERDPNFQFWQQQWAALKQIESHLVHWKQQLPELTTLLDTRAIARNQRIEDLYSSTKNSFSFEQTWEELQHKKSDISNRLQQASKTDWQWTSSDTKALLNRYNKAKHTLALLEQNNQLTKEQINHYHARLQRILGRLTWLQYEESLSLYPLAQHTLKQIDVQHHESHATAERIKTFINHTPVQDHTKQALKDYDYQLHKAFIHLNKVFTRVIGITNQKLMALQRKALLQHHQWLTEALYHRARLSEALDMPMDTRIGYYRDVLNSESLINAHPNRFWTDIRSNHVQYRLAQLSLDRGEEIVLESPENTQLLEESIALLTLWIATFPEDDKQPNAWYLLARAYDTAGNIKKSYASLAHLNQHYPDHRLSHEAAFRLAERAYTEERFDDALNHYQTVLTTKEQHELHTNALYMSGWSLFKLSRYAEAFDYFDQVLTQLYSPPLSTDTITDIQSHTDVQSDNGITEQATSSEDNSLYQSVLEDSYRISAIIASYQQGTQSIIDYYAEHPEYQNSPPPHGIELFKRLALHYQQNERWIDALAVYEAVQLTYPMHQMAQAFKKQEIDVLIERKQFADARLTKAEYVLAYGHTSHYWQQTSNANRQQINPILEGYLIELAEYTHAAAQQAAQETRSKSTIDPQPLWLQSISWYEQLVSGFPNHPDHHQHQFLLAEALFESGQYQQSIAWYRKLGYETDPISDDLKERSAYALLAAYQQQIEQVDPNEIDVYTQWRMAFLNEQIRFTNTFPEHSRTESLLTYAATDALELGQVDTAQSLARRLLKLPNPRQASLSQAYSILGDGYYQQQQYQQAADYYQQAITRLPNDEQVPAWRQQLANSLYQQGFVHAQQEAWDLATDNWLSIEVYTPEHELVVPALMETATVWIQTEKIADAEILLIRIRDQYPQHPLTSQVPLKLSQIYEQQKDSTKAAPEYYAVYQTSTDTAAKQAALWASANHYQSAKQEQKAIEVYSEYLTAFNLEFEQTIEVQHRLMHLTRDNPKQRRYWSEALIATDLQAAQPTEESRKLAIAAALEIAQQDQKVFNQTKITLPLEESFSLKQQQMEHAIAAYERVMSYQNSDAYHLAQLSIGELYYQLSRDLYDSERPLGLSELELEQYDLLLEEEAYPFEEKAIELWEENFQRMYEGDYDRSIEQSLLYLQHLLPGRYRRIEQQGGLSEYWY